jgi:hypothetical protein
MIAKLIMLSITSLLTAFLTQQTVCAKSNLDPRVELALNWLPANTESISILQSPVTYDVNSDQPIDPESVYQSAFVLPILVNTEHTPMTGELAIPMSDIELSIQAVGRWTNDMQRTKPGCRPLSYVSFMRQDQKRDSKIRKCLRRHAHETFKDCGQLVFKLVIGDICGTNSKKHQDTVFYKCLTREGLVIVTSDRTLMHTILSRMVSEQVTDRALPANLPEWREVDTQVRYWGLRHFQPDDPTSPMSGMPYTARTYPRVDRQATGFAFSYSPESETLDTRYLSRNPDIKQIVEAIVNVKLKHIGNTKWDPAEIEQTKPGVVRMKVVPLEKGWPAALYSVHAWLGAPTPWPFGG